MPNIKNENGASFILTIMITFMLILFVAVTANYAHTELKSTTKHQRQMTAHNVANAGLERAVYEINAKLAKGENPAGVLIDNDFHGGSYEATITDVINDYGEQIGYLIESTGTFAGETTTIWQHVREAIWPEGPIPKQFQYAIFANRSISIEAMSGLLGLGFIETHRISVKGDIHANNSIYMDHIGLFTTDPYINGKASSANTGNISIPGMPASAKIKEKRLPLPQFDFDYARKKAKKDGVYIPHSLLSISLLGLSPTDKVIFIDGDLVITGLDLLGISLMKRTIVVNGTITCLLEVGAGPLIDTELNLIAKEDINFVGALTGTKIKGILFAQENITSAGHLEVKGYMGANRIQCGAGLLSSVFGLLTGSMAFYYNENVFHRLPSDIGFKQMYVEVIEQGEYGG